MINVINGVNESFGRRLKRSHRAEAVGARGKRARVLTPHAFFTSFLRESGSLRRLENGCEGGEEEYILETTEGRICSFTADISQWNTTPAPSSFLLRKHLFRTEEGAKNPVSITCSTSSTSRESGLRSAQEPKRLVALLSPWPLSSRE